MTSSKNFKFGAVYGIVFVVFFVAAQLPGWLHARKDSPRDDCISHMKQIWLAAEIWGGDHNDQLPTNLLQMSNELTGPNILVCPADTQHKSVPETASPEWNATNISYALLTPGMSLASVTNKIVVRCPIHGFELMGNGSVLTNDPLTASP